MHQLRRMQLLDNGGERPQTGTTVTTWHQAAHVLQKEKHRWTADALVATHRGKVKTFVRTRVAKTLAGILTNGFGDGGVKNPCHTCKVCPAFLRRNGREMFVDLFAGKRVEEHGSIVALPVTCPHVSARKAAMHVSFWTFADEGFHERLLVVVSIPAQALFAMRRASKQATWLREEEYPPKVGTRVEVMINWPRTIAMHPRTKKLMVADHP